MIAGKFSRYELHEALGSGGMATVYRAYDPLFDRYVALKILRQELLENSQQRERFELETKIIAKLEHEAIVPVHDVGRDNNQLFYVMRYMSGGSLSERMQNGPMSPAAIIPIIERIAPALDYAHEKGIIHRDLKPGNILFDESDHAFISDFGIARFVHAPIRLTKDGIIGTPTYMSPEQAQGEDVDGRSDIYSLGVIVFEMLSGRTPFEATTPLSIAVKHITLPAPHIRAINPDLPEAIDDVMEKVLAKDRDQRYGTSVEFADALINALSEAAEAPTQTLEKPVLHPEARPRYWMMAGLIALALISFGLWKYVPSLIAPDTPTAVTVTASATLPVPTHTPLTPTPTETPVPTSPAVIPTVITAGGADKIAFTAKNEIYVMNIDGSGIESLTKTGLPKFDLQWLPGGYELLFVQGNCVYKIDVKTDDQEGKEVVCFTDQTLTGFRVSPDGTRVAISIANRLLVLPYDIQTLVSAPSAFELQKLETLCLNYTDVTVKDAQWSADGSQLAVRYQSAFIRRLGETIRVMEVNWSRCGKVPPLIWDEFPGDHFVPEGYERYPTLPSYQWDGDEQFLFNSYIRNKNYGDLYLYNMSTNAVKTINPVDGVCCYGSAAFSPDGSHILFVFQDVRDGSNSENQLYYVPIDQIESTGPLVPFRLPSLFPDLRENIQLALHPYP